VKAEVLGYEFPHCHHNSPPHCTSLISNPSLCGETWTTNRLSKDEVLSIDSILDRGVVWRTKQWPKLLLLSSYLFADLFTYQLTDLTACSSTGPRAVYRPVLQVLSTALWSFLEGRCTVCYWIAHRRCLCGWLMKGLEVGGVSYRKLIVAVNTGRFIIYSGITKMYYRKTVGHVFNTPVQIEGTIHNFFPTKFFFHRSSHFCR